MIGLKRLAPASLLALLLGLVPLAPAQAQGGGLLGDSEVLSGQGGESDARGAPRADRRRARPQRVIDVAPYLEVDQTAIVDLKGGDGDVLTYTSVAAGVDASIQTRSVAIRADLRYEHQFGWGKTANDQDIISGLVTGRADLVPNILSLEGGGLATRVRTDGFVGANSSLAAASSTSNVFSAYLGPNLTMPIGDLTLTGAYRLGYNRLDIDNDFPTDFNLPAGPFEESWIHNATASVGMQPGVLPFGWSVGGGYTLETSSQLDQRYEDRFVRGDVTVPVSPTVALVGGVGYQKIGISNRDAVRGPDGAPLRDDNGRFITDHASPRRLSYDQSGLIWDAGVLWRPGRHLSAEARVGRHYGSMSYTGSLAWQPSRNSSIQVTLFDSIDSFGRALNGGLANLGTSFIVDRNPFTGDLGGCAFANGSSGGACFNDTLAGISSASFRHRGVVAQFERTAERWSVMAATGFSRRKFVGAGTAVLASVDGLADDYYFGVLGVSRKLDADSSLDANAYANYFDSGISDVEDVTNLGANIAYRRTLLRRLAASAAAGVDSIDRKGHEAFVSLLAQIGLRYQF